MNLCYDLGATQDSTVYFDNKNADQAPALMPEAGVCCGEQSITLVNHYQSWERQQNPGDLRSRSRRRVLREELSVPVITALKTGRSEAGNAGHIDGATRTHSEELAPGNKWGAKAWEAELSETP